jgi:hypothetical protein
MTLGCRKCFILPGASPLAPRRQERSALRYSPFQRSKGMKGTKAKDIGRSPRLRRRTVRLSDYEDMRVKEQADVAGLPVAAYIRRILASSAPVIAETDLLMIRELRRMGGLLKNNFVALRQAGADKTLLEHQEEILRKTGQAIDRIAGSDDR